MALLLPIKWKVFVLKTETKAVELTVDLTLLLLKSVLFGNIPGTLFSLIVSLVILCDLMQTIDTNRCSNRKLRAAEGASDSGSPEVCRRSLYLGPWPRQKCPANTICFVISQLHFHNPAARFHFSTQNENVCECGHFPACSFYEDSELEQSVLLNHNRQ